MDVSSLLRDVHVGNERVFDALTEKLQSLAVIDATPLMVTFCNLIVQDNRTGVLAGLDKDGNPLADVKYRPIISSAGPLSARGRSDREKQLRHRQKPNRLRDLLFRGAGSHESGENNNLTSSEYRRLDGPPLAPRYQFSRVISNLKVAYAPLNPEPGNTHWEAWGYWDEVVDRDGRPFLHYLFDGTGRMPARDLRGVRPEGLEKARAAASAWFRDYIRAHVG